MDKAGQLIARLRARANLLVAVAGVACLGVGGQLQAPEDETWQAIVLGTGASLLAASVATWLIDIAEPEDVRIARHMRSMGIESAFPNRAELGDDFWLQRIHDTKRRYSVLGVASHRYHNTAQRETAFEAEFMSAAIRKVDVEILFLNPDSEHARLRDAEEARGTRGDIADSVTWYWRLKKSLPEAHRDQIKLYEYDGTPTCGITWADDEIIVSTYLARELNVEAPGLVLSSTNVGAGLAGKYVANFMEIMRDAVEIDQQRVDALAAKRQAFKDEGGPSEGDLR